MCLSQTPHDLATTIGVLTEMGNQDAIPDDIFMGVLVPVLQRYVEATRTANPGKTDDELGIADWAHQFEMIERAHSKARREAQAQEEQRENLLRTLRDELARRKLEEADVESFPHLQFRC